MKIHPAAQIFPLMSESELKDLAEDIAANGLKQPITLAGDGSILDGRNRLKACEMAHVEPVFVTANGDDALSLVISLNVKRRNLTAAQKAISAAEAWELIAGTHADSRAKKLARLFGVNNAYVSQARALVERDPDAAAAVKIGTSRLAEAYDALQQRERALASDEKELARLASTYPDLADHVNEGILSLAVAKAEAADRDKHARLEREAATTNLIDVLTKAALPVDKAVRQAELIDTALAAQRGADISPTKIDEAISFLSELARHLRERQET